MFGVGSTLQGKPTPHFGDVNFRRTQLTRDGMSGRWDPPTCRASFGSSTPQRPRTRSTNLSFDLTADHRPCRCQHPRQPRLPLPRPQCGPPFTCRGAWTSA
eukprot:2457846-Rhodomonas_salina.1